VHKVDRVDSRQVLRGLPSVLRVSRVDRVNKASRDKDHNKTDHSRVEVRSQDQQVRILAMDHVHSVRLKVVRVDKAAARIIRVASNVTPNRVLVRHGQDRELVISRNPILKSINVRFTVYDVRYVKGRNADF
jgi:hypothetical protein